MAESDLNKYLKNLPAGGKLIYHPKIKELIALYPRNIIMQVIHNLIEDMRNKILSSNSDGDLKDIDLSTDGIIPIIYDQVKSICLPSMGHIINATGIILSTNLGRAPLSKPAQEALINATRGYSPLAVDFETGRRGDRDTHVQKLLEMLTGAESATVANNNAAATMLILNSIAKGKEVLVSRGQLVEIGGDFQLVEVIHRSGAIPIEVGSTNRTHLKNYKDAITENTGAILRVHPSNYRIIGFTEEVGLDELVQLGKEHNIPIIDDLGSGALFDLTKYGLPAEPLVADSVKAGADVVCFSGDKLLSGPQAGIIIGKKKYIQMIKKNPLARMLRVCKLTVTALEATLRLYLNEETIAETNPTLKILTRPLAELEEIADTLVKRLSKSLEKKAIVQAIDDYSQVGGGSLPTENIPTKLISIKPLNMSTDTLGIMLRKSAPPIFSRIQQDCVLLDLRTVFADEVDLMADALESCFVP
ncbi:MAG: L-seryl-tRNA(Sec) selenium transferase [Candidatus Poribacteria bacterium]